MKNKFLFSLLLLPCFANANQVSLDSLVSNTGNFCNQGQEGKLTGVLSFLNLNNNSDIYFKGFKVTRIEIKTPQVVTQFNSAKLQEESKKYVMNNKNYPFKNLYSIGYLISFIVDTPVENLKSKIENFNPSTGSYYKRFGEYKATDLQQSKSMEDFENNLKTIQVPEYNLTIMANYETNSPKSSLIYQCKMVAYTNEDITTITNKANK